MKTIVGESKPLPASLQEEIKQAARTWNRIQQCQSRALENTFD